MNCYFRTTLIVLTILSFLRNEVAFADAAGNHQFFRVELGYPSGVDCSFEYSSIHFCDERHLSAIKEAIETKSPNFNNDFILLSIPERRVYFEHSLVAIDSKTGIIYPLPFDAYSGYIDKRGSVHDYGKLSYKLDGREICIRGAVSAYKDISSGKLCWVFDGAKFVGHHTPYMD